MNMIQNVDEPMKDSIDFRRITITGEYLTQQPISLGTNLIKMYMKLATGARVNGMILTEYSDRIPINNRIVFP